MDEGCTAESKIALLLLQAMNGDSDDASDRSGDSSEAEELSDGGMGSARGKKRKADAEEEDDYDPLEDHLDGQHADGSASDAEDKSPASSDAPDSDEETVPMQSSCRSQRQRDSNSAKRQSRGARGKKTVPAPAREEQSGSEEDDFELQQALAMSLLDRQQPGAQNTCLEVPAPAHLEAASAHAEPAAGQAAQKEPGTATLEAEHIEAATIESRLAGEQAQGTGAATLAASVSKADAAQDKAAAVKAEMQGTIKPRAQAWNGQKGRKQPAKGKSIEIRDLADIGRAYDMICGSTGAIREHHLQQVYCQTCSVGSYFADLSPVVLRRRARVCAFPPHVHSALNTLFTEHDLTGTCQLDRDAWQ